MVRSATRNFCFLPETLSPACGQTAAALGPFRRGAFIDRSPGFHSGTACPCPPILCISAMVSARFRLIAPLASWTCAPRSRLWIVATVQSQQPSANQRVRNLHHEGTVSRRHALYSPSGGIVLDLLGCISARVLQCEGTLFLSRTGAGSLQRSRHRGAPYPHHSRGGKRVRICFPTASNFPPRVDASDVVSPPRLPASIYRRYEASPWPARMLAGFGRWAGIALASHHRVDPGTFIGIDRRADAQRHQHPDHHPV